MKSKIKLDVYKMFKYGLLNELGYLWWLEIADLLSEARGRILEVLTRSARRDLSESGGQDRI